MRTIREPHEPLPRLEDLLEYLAQPEFSKIWLLLDIKVMEQKVQARQLSKLTYVSQMTNEPEAILRRMSEAVTRVKPAKDSPWENRIVLGCWAVWLICA